MTTAGEEAIVEEPQVPSPPELQRLLPRYELVDQLADTNMSVVWRARDTTLGGREVALKVLLPDLAADPGYRDRFRREIEIAARLQHPNVIPILSSGQEAGMVYVVMPYVDGPDLADLIAQRGRLGLPETVRVVNQIAGALTTAHRRHLVHRDIKPGNVLVDVDAGWHVYLCDFGIVKNSDGTASLATTAGSFLGTPLYAAPEQFPGAGGKVGPYTDQYALACTAYECLTGVTPFDTEDNLADAHLFTDPPRLTEKRPDLPAGLSDVLVRALAKRPSDRYDSCDAFAKAFTAAAGMPDTSTDQFPVAKQAPDLPTPTPTPAQSPSMQVTDLGTITPQSAAVDGQTVPRKRGWSRRWETLTVAAVILGVVVTTAALLMQGPSGGSPNAEAGDGSVSTSPSPAVSVTRTASPKPTATPKPTNTATGVDTRPPVGQADGGDQPRAAPSGRAGGGGSTQSPPANRRQAPTGTPNVRWVSPADEGTVRGTVHLTVQTANWGSIGQVEFQYEDKRCSSGDMKKYLGKDLTPDANGRYTFPLDTTTVRNGCLDLIATAKGKDGELYPQATKGVWIDVTVDN